MATSGGPIEISAILQARLKDYVARALPDDARFKSALFRIAFLLETEIKKNVQKKGIIDTGALLNSIGFQFFRDGELSGVKIGSFGVPYATINEYGGTLSPAQVKEAFARMRQRRGKRNDRGKGILSINSDGSGKFKARPFLRPAVTTQRTRVVSILRELFTQVSR